MKKSVNTAPQPIDGHIHEWKLRREKALERARRIKQEKSPVLHMMPTVRSCLPCRAPNNRYWSELVHFHPLSEAEQQIRAECSATEHIDFECIIRIQFRVSHFERLCCHFEAGMNSSFEHLYGHDASWSTNWSTSAVTKLAQALTFLNHNAKTWSNFIDIFSCSGADKSKSTGGTPSTNYGLLLRLSGAPIIAHGHSKVHHYLLTGAP